MSPSPSPSPAIPHKVYSREANGSLTIDTTDLATIYTTPEEGDVRNNDDIFVGILGQSSEYLMHLFKKTNGNREDNFNIRAVVKSTLAPTSSAILLQIWNGTTLSWETIATNNSAGLNEKLSLDAFVPTNESNYYDFGEQVAVRVYQLNNSALQVTLSIDQFRFLFVPQYQEMYAPVGNRYIDTYLESNLDYTKKFPSKNPQDDL